MIIVSFPIACDFVRALTRGDATRASTPNCARLLRWSCVELNRSCHARAKPTQLNARAEATRNDNLSRFSCHEAGVRVAHDRVERVWLPASYHEVLRFLLIKPTPSVNTPAAKRTPPA